MHIKIVWMNFLWRVESDIFTIANDKNMYSSQTITLKLADEWMAFSLTKLMFVQRQMTRRNIVCNGNDVHMKTKGEKKRMKNNLMLRLPFDYFTINAMDTNSEPHLFAIDCYISSRKCSHIHFTWLMKCYRCYCMNTQNSLALRYTAKRQA